MLLSSEYRTIINECQSKIERGECTLPECNNCPTIVTAYFLRNYAMPTPEIIESILTQKKNYSE